MPRSRRIIKANIAYHVLNRANGRLRIFKKDADFEAFKNILAQAVTRFKIRLTGFCIMSNHWHLLLWPDADDQLSDFMKWLTVTHTQCWHGAHGTYGMGHIYQGRFKSFPIDADEHYLTVLKYIESNPLRAGIVSRSQDWPWSSLAIRNGAKKELTLSDGPVELPRNWNKLVNIDLQQPQKFAINNSIKRSSPYGREKWTNKTASDLKLESTLKPIGRPKKRV